MKDRFVKKTGILMVFVMACLLLNAQADTVVICNPGDQAQLQATPDQFAYTWSPPRYLSATNISNPIATPSQHTTYVVQMIPGLLSDNLVSNPNFNLGRTSFTSEYKFATSIRTQGLFGINESARNLNPVSFSDCPDHTTGDGKMLIVDGSPEPNAQIWCQTIDVVPNAQYAFSAWLTSVNPDNPAALQFFINSKPIGEVFRASPRVCHWQQFYNVWSSETSTRAVICIVNQNTNSRGNDFALDDFAFHEIEDVVYDSTVVFVEAVEAAKDRNVFIPNVFTPNGDQINDTFRPFFGKGALKIESLKIFDRWGRLVYETGDCNANEIDCGWDGTSSRGFLMTDDYAYAIRIQYADQVIETRTGTIRLLR